MDIRAHIKRVYASMARSTAMSRAFMRAIGEYVAHDPREYAGRIAPAEHIEYDEGVLWCFSNHGSPMDGRF